MTFKDKVLAAPAGCRLDWRPRSPGGQGILRFLPIRASRPRHRIRGSLRWAAMAWLRWPVLAGILLAEAWSGPRGGGMPHRLDRMLITQAVTEPLHLLTSDDELSQYSGLVIAV